jgi:hypothetical protein
MQNLFFDGERLKTEIIYEGTTFTLIKATYQNGERMFTAEGLSRRSHLDSPNPELGRSIALGRAKKALRKKINHEIIHHNLMG